MVIITRREFGLMALAGLAWRRAHAQTVAGVRLGVQTYSFRELPREPGGDATAAMIAAMNACGITECELWAPQIEPEQQGGRGRTPEEVQNEREDLRAWRVKTPLDHFRNIRQAFAKDGLSIYAYNYSPNDAFSDEEIDRGFEIARALGAEIITASTNLVTAKRMAPFMERHKMVVAVHNHSNVMNPNEFATPASFAAAMALSEYFKINLDIGHFTAANFDPVAYLREHHANVTNLHIKDRKRDQGDNTPWGMGDTPILEVMALVRREKWPIRAYVEYEYRGESGAVDEVKECWAYMTRALA